MSCMRGEVCKEALVQVVNSQHIVCQPHVIKVRHGCVWIVFLIPERYEVFLKIMISVLFLLHFPLR